MTVETLRLRILTVLGQHGNARFAWDSVGVLALKIVGQLLILVVTVAMTRVMGAAEYGTFAYLIALSFAVVLVATLGLPMAANKIVSRYTARGRIGRSRRFILFGTGAIVAASLVCGTLFDLVWVWYGAADLSWWHLTGLILTMALMRFLTDTARALGRPLLGFGAETAGVRLLYLIGVGAALLLPLGLSVRVAVEVYIVANAVVVAVLLAAVLARVRTVEANPPRRMAPLYRQWGATALLMLTTPLFFYVISETDILVLGLVGSPAEVGVYQVARRLAELTMFCSIAINGVGLARLAECHALRQPDRLQRTVDLMMVLSAVPTVGVALVLLAFGEPLLRLFGPDFTAGYVAMGILAAYRTIDVLTGPASEVLMMTGHHHRVFRANLAFAAANVVVVAVFASLWGLEGAALGTATGTLLWKAAMYAMVRRLTPYETSILVRLARLRARAA